MARIAVIEDEPQIRKMICEEFLEVGHDVRSAHDGVSGFELVREWRPDVVCSDVNMPNMDGFQMVEALQVRGFDASTVSFIFVSAQTGDEFVADGLMLGAAHYIKKPVDFDMLHAIISGLVKTV